MRWLVFFCLLLLTMGPALSQGQPLLPSAYKPGDPPLELLVSVIINRMPLDEPIQIKVVSPVGVLLTLEDYAKLRLTNTKPIFVSARDGELVALSRIDGLRYSIDERTQTLTIDAEARLFGDKAFDVYSERTPKLTATPAGAFINYDYAAFRAANQTNQNLALETGFFSSWGGLVSTQVFSRDNTGDKGTRLESYFFRDFPDTVTTLRVGDAISVTNEWGRPVRYAGIQYRTNFNVNPQFITSPLLTVGGQTALPSTVDVYVNNAVVARRELSPGAFSINNLPVVSGQGTVRLVVRDILGREQVIEQPFFSTPVVLRDGLSAFSVDAGAVRDGQGDSSRGYGRVFLSGDYRRGISDQFTLAGHIESSGSDLVTLGGAGAGILASNLTWGVSAAGSRAEVGGVMRTGALFSASVDYSPRDFRFGISQTGASRNFRQLGSLQSLMQIKRVTTANVGISIKNSIGLGLALVEQVPYDNPKTQIATLSGSLRITNKLNASATLSKTRSQDSFGVSNDDTAAFINFLYTFDERHSASADAQRNGGRSTGALNISRQLAAGDSWGYRAFVDSEREIRLNGLLQNRFGNFSLQANRSATKENSYALEASGAIAVAGWTAAPARKIDSSFAMVVMPGFPGVKVYSNAQAETYTDSRGVAVVAGLTPYAENNIRIDPRELPLDTKISRSSSKIVPAAKAGVRVDLGVKRSQAATFRVVFEDGQAAPAGAAIYRLDRDEMLPVGYDGLVYMEDLATRNTFELRWKGQRCTLTIDYQSGNDPLPDLGDVLCKGVKR